MSKLSPLKEKFAKAVADGHSQTQSLRIASNADTKKWKPATLHNKASALSRESEVKARVDELRGELAEKELWTRADSVKALSKIVDSNDAKNNDIVSSVKELNSMHGFNAPTKMDIKSEVKAEVTTIDPGMLSDSAVEEILSAAEREKESQELDDE